MPRQTRCTPEQDAIILSMPESLAAERLGFTPVQVRSRRYKLNKDGGQARAKPAKPSLPTPFARPDWFDEDLTAMTKGAVSG